MVSKSRRSATYETRKLPPRNVGKPPRKAVTKSTPKIIEKPPQLIVQKQAPKATEKPTVKVVNKSSPKVVEKIIPKVVQKPIPKVVEKTTPKVVEKPPAKVVEKQSPKIVEQAVKIEKQTTVKVEDKPLAPKGDPKTQDSKTSAPVTDQKESLDALVQPDSEDNRQGLDGITQDILEEELELMMTKVWKCVSDTASNAEDNFIVDYFSSDVLYDFRNALGLHVTQRLLKVFNALTVKVHFSTKPEREYLKDFLQKYNFVAFKRIEQETNAFGAQVRTIDDFDALCNDKEIVCGAAKITISPCYQFTKCPKGLKSVYDIFNKDNLDDKDGSETQTEGSESNDTAKVAGNSNKNKAEMESISANNKTVKDINETTKDKSNEKDENSTDMKDSKMDTSAITPNISNKVDEKLKTNNAGVEPKVSNKVNDEPKTDKSAEKTNVTNKTESDKSTTPVIQCSESAASTVKTTNLKAADKSVTLSTPNKDVSKCVNKVTNASEIQKAVVDSDKNKLVVAHNTNQSIPATTAIKQTKPLDSAKKVTKTESKKITSKNLEIGNKMSATKSINKSPSNLKKVSKKSEKYNDDFEELDDHAILALMSEGIVLDECTGSDDD